MINSNFKLPDEIEYKKYRGTYTKYAIYIDKHIPDIAESYKNPEIETNVFNCIYKICYMIACKKKYFEGPTSFQNYDDFALFAATEFYSMFKSKYVKKGEISRGKEVKPIKSSLNMIKRVLPSFLVEYTKKYFYQMYRDEWGDEEDNLARKELERKKKAAVSNYIKTDVTNSYNYRVVEAVESTCSNVPYIIKEILQNTPYKNDKVTQERLYKSCILSFINSITLPNEILDKVENNMKFEQLNKKFKKERDNCIILWHLDEKMAPYVGIILTRIREAFVKEVKEDIEINSLDETTLNDILSTAYNTYDTNQSDKDF